VADSWSTWGVVDAMHAVVHDIRLMRTPFLLVGEFCRTQVNPLLRWIGRNHDGAL
jgi:hypothetical protein